MDGHFVPNITFGPPVVKSLIGKTALPMEAHLMIADPFKYGAVFAKLGVEIITAHIEVLSEAAQWEKFRKAMGTPVGIAINPPTPLKDAAALVEHFDLILPMSVNPGFSGQRFMPEALPKIEAVANEAQRRGLTRLIAVDGGIDKGTIKLVRAAGANFIIAGNAFFKAKDYRAAARILKGER